MGITDRSRQQSIARQKAKQVITQAETTVERAKTKEEIKAAINLLRQQAEELKYEDVDAYTQVCKNIRNLSSQL